MNIVYFTTVYLPHIGGIEFYVRDMAQYSIKMGDSVTIVVADRESSEVQEYYEDCLKIVHIPTYSFAEFFILKNRKVRNVVDGIISDADLIHLNSCKFLYKYLVDKKSCNHYKLVISSHGWLFHTNNHILIKKIYFKYIVARLAIAYDRIINVSSQDQMIAREYGIEKSVVISSGTDCIKFRGLKEKESFESRFIYFGRIARNKGIIECLKKLKKYGKAFEFRIIGACDDALYMEEIANYVKENGLEKCVFFLGRLTDDQIRIEIEKSDIILMPSLHEGFGLTLVECLPSNRPIIANTIDSYKFILRSVKAEEFLFDYADSDASIENKVSELITKRIRPINIEQFSTEEMASKTYKEYISCKL